MHWRANNMKPLSILLLLSLIVFSHCWNDPKKKPSALRQFNEKALFVCFIGRFGLPTYEDKFYDTADGAISLISVSTNGSEYCPFPPLAKTEFVDAYNAKSYIKKCIQGQVYRKEQNDCKGAGTAANYWNAQKYQFCTANDRSCEKLDSSGNYVIDETKSPAALACKNDKTNGITWYITGSVSTKTFPFFKRPDEIPLSESDFFWGGTPFDSSTAYALSIDPSKNIQKANKSSFNYVLCAGYR
jgi:hypothetical protein